MARWKRVELSPRPADPEPQLPAAVHGQLNESTMGRGHLRQTCLALRSRFPVAAVMSTPVVKRKRPNGLAYEPFTTMCSPVKPAQVSKQGAVCAPWTGRCGATAICDNTPGHHGFFPPGAEKTAVSLCFFPNNRVGRLRIVTIYLVTVYLVLGIAAHGGVPTSSPSTRDPLFRIDSVPRAKHAMTESYRHRYSEFAHQERTRLALGPPLSIATHVLDGS
ncbi:uncharacterized protein B0I36DRAFT_429737 [Microdochium trichocladiopsis]|uniref:Uncharacterized protein n=1 Tax=Microdochium trichocladiopsis TaxID=1682393 RepID=A0A9P8YES3_9PEZI|nr:uncharacterized protein B0I36DRAFT_429737 [Microdochium trichocladiopsis]KAH7035673.1 hypothetical protein B0I36DRAFT_429737 [Microdochium trichocladiopsis]